MNNNQKPNSFYEYENQVLKNPKDNEIKIDFADYIVDELCFYTEKNKEHPDKAKLLARLETLIKDIPSNSNSYFAAYLAFAKGDKKDFLLKIKKFLDRLKDEEPFTMEDYIAYFHPFISQSFEGMCKSIGQYCDDVWPNSAVALTMFGLDELEKSESAINEDKTMDFFGKAIAQDETFWIASYFLAEIYYKNQIWKSSIRYYQQTLKYELAEDPYKYFQLAWCYGKINNYQEEEQAYRKCLKFDPKYKYANNNLGWSLYKQKKYADAIKIFEFAIKNNLDGIYPYNNKLRSLKRLGKYSEAIKFIEDTLVKKKRGKSLEKELEELKALVAGKEIVANDEESDQDVSSNEIELEYFPKDIEIKTKPGQFKTSNEKALEIEIENNILKGIPVFNNKQLKMYDGEMYGRQYNIPEIGRIDLLTQEVGTNNYYVIELKKGESDDEVVGQISRYMAWVKKNLATKGEEVYGIICVYQATEKLILAASIIPKLNVIEYGVHFKQVL